jgi:hypothetical protein
MQCLTVFYYRATLNSAEQPQELAGAPFFRLTVLILALLAVTTFNMPWIQWRQEQQQGENRVKSMLFHMFGEGALLTTCSKRRPPPGADMPGEWICRHRA